MNTCFRICNFCFSAELGDYDEEEHTPELVSEFRFIPEQSEEFEEDIVEKFKSLKYVGKLGIMKILPHFFLLKYFLPTAE